VASEIHNVKKQNFCDNIEDHSLDLPRKRISNFTNKNTKEVKKSPKLNCFALISNFVVERVNTGFNINLTATSLV
uniref:Uncharacterized protein n=1 Tax=Castor canadensis TaxID=51338 RepID=A0A8C0XN57_CASCN